MSRSERGDRRLPAIDFRRLLEALPLVVYVDALDDVSSALYMSPQAEEMLGYPVEQWVEEPDLFARILHPDDREWVLRAIQRSNDAHELFHAEYRLLARDGSVVWVQDQSVAFGGEETFAVGYLVDITRRKQSEADQALLARERAELAAELEREKDRSVLLATASHELRTPLASVYGGAQTLLHRSSLGAAERERLLHVMVAEAERLRAVVDSILTASSLEAGAFELALEATSAAVIVEEAVQRARERARREARIAFEHVEAPLARADPERLRQVLDNLLDNALKFSPEVAEILVSVTSSEGRVQIAVSDRGIGIAPEESERVFERFYRASEAKERQPSGTGLGLYVVRELVERMGGEVRLEPNPGGGARFSFSLEQAS
ncbi:MAG TPA: ATP-binding protein [Gaiellaceae bacterium]|nr:ATP-binding protein [Gaiellaceae bacterium]